MEEADRSRRAARLAVDDVTPEALRAVIEDEVARSSMVPGVLTILSAGAVDGDPDREAVTSRAAGVQLIYEGLRLTRDLVGEDPWSDDPGPNSPADVEILAADVAVARGFRLLARTEAAGQAVETVREFGREQSSDDASGARGLEENVFELAVIAGASAGGGEPPVAMRQYAVGLARSRGPPLAGAEESLPERIEDVLRRVNTAPTGDGARASAQSANRND